MDPYGVIFDMDGVLVDSYQAHYESWRQVAAERGLAMNEADFARTFGRTSREIIQQLWPDRFDDEQALAFDRDKEAAYRRILEADFPEVKGAGELLASLHAAGFRMAIGSSGPRENVEATRRRLSNGQLISAIVHGGLVHRGKPDPEVFLIAARELGLPPGRCAVVEDAPVGLEAARRAGMKAVALTGTADPRELFARADLVVHSLRELSPERIAALIDGSSLLRGP